MTDVLRTSRRHGGVVIATSMLLVSACALSALVDVLPGSVYRLGYAAVTLGAGLLAVVGAGAATRRSARVFAAGVLVSGVGDLVWAVDSLSRTVPSPSPADALYVLSYILLAASLFAEVARGSDDGVDVDAVVDACTTIVVVVLVLYLVTGLGDGVDASLNPTGRALLVAYPVLDSVLVGLVIRLVLAHRLGGRAGALFLVGIGAWLAANVSALVNYLGGAFDRWTGLGWMAGVVLMALLAWAPVRSRPARGAGSPVTGRVLMAVLPLSVPTWIDAVGDRGIEPAWVLLIATVVLTVLGLMRVSRIIRRELSTREALAEERATSQAQARVVATVSHELRGPMTGVLGYAEMLSDTDLDTQQRRLTRKLSEAGQSLLATANNVLDFSRLQAGRVELHLAPFVLAELLESVADLARHANPCGEVVVLVECDPVTPHVLVGDEVRLRQVLFNLLGNALKFTERGVVRLCVTGVGHSEAGGREVVRLVRFEVRDSGPGIEQRDLQRIFEPFTQAGNGTQQGSGGAGLGLTISRGLIESMGGELRAESTVGLGSRFWFTLPLPVAGPTMAGPGEVAVPERRDALGGFHPKG